MATIKPDWIKGSQISPPASYKITATDVQAIVAAIRNNDSSLLAVNLSGNGVNAEATKAIGEALKVNSSLTTLYLYSNQIGDDGAKAIGEALKVNSSLTTLWLGGNQIGDEGAKAIGEALKVNSSLTILYLYNNEIGDKGGKALRDALKLNWSLTTLDVDYNNISDEIKKEIKSEIERNKNKNSQEAKKKSLKPAAATVAPLAAPPPLPASPPPKPVAPSSSAASPSAPPAAPSKSANAPPSNAPVPENMLTVLMDALEALKRATERTRFFSAECQQTTARAEEMVQRVREGRLTPASASASSSASASTAGEVVAVIGEVTQLLQSAAALFEKLSSEDNVLLELLSGPEFVLSPLFAIQHKQLQWEEEFGMKPPAGLASAQQEEQLRAEQAAFLDRLEKNRDSILEKLRAHLPAGSDSAEAVLNRLATRLKASYIKRGGGVTIVQIQELKYTDMARGRPKPVAKGAFGQVYRGILNGRLVAIKELDEQNEKTVAEVKQEGGILGDLRHPNVVSLLGVILYDVDTGTPLPILVYEWMPGGTLQERFQKHQESVVLPAGTPAGHWPPLPFPREQDRLRMVAQLFAALTYLHSERPAVVHRDIKPDNIMFSEEGVLKLTDFGLARVRSESQYMKTMAGTTRWMAPEVARGQPHSTGVDVWAAALVAHKLYTGEDPWGKYAADPQVSKALLDGEAAPLNEQRLPAKSLMGKVVRSALRLDAKQRAKAPVISMVLEMALQRGVADAVASETSLDPAVRQMISAVFP